MKTAKLVTGILCMVLTVFVLFQSCAVGLANTLGDTGEISGTAGFLVAVLMLAGGIVEVVTRNSAKKGGSVACMILFFLAALIGFGNAGSYADLNIWSAWCLILGVVNLVCVVKSGAKAPQSLPQGAPAPVAAPAPAPAPAAAPAPTPAEAPAAAPANEP